jgi:hypothetical protein
MLAHHRAIWIAVWSLVILPTYALGQGVQVSCEQYARDYSNMVAPRSGGAVIANPMNPYASGNPRGNQNTQMRGDTEWRQMAPNQDAYRMAYDRCMSNRR